MDMDMDLVPNMLRCISLLGFGHRVSIKVIGERDLRNPVRGRMIHDLMFLLGKVHEGITFYHSMLNNTMDRYRFPLFGYWFHPSKVRKLYALRYISYDREFDYALPNGGDPMYLTEGNYKPVIFPDEYFRGISPLLQLLNTGHDVWAWFDRGLRYGVPLSNILSELRSGIGQYIDRECNGMPIVFTVNEEVYGFGFSRWFYPCHRF